MSWNLTNGGQPGEIEGYCNAVSAQRGDTVALFVSTVAPSFHVEAYRMGSYGGTGGRLVWHSGPTPGEKQAPPVVLRRTNTVEARWKPSIEIKLTDEFIQGTYLFKLIASTGVQHLVPLTIRDDSSTAAYLVQNSVTTWQAYNLWGGYSLYGRGQTGADFKNRARIVSFDRPYAETGGSGEFLGLELPLVMLVEQLGLDVTYVTDVDVHQHPERLLKHKAYFSLGHDEYWSKQMRDGVEAARDHGVNLAFLGANAAFRQIRLERSSLGADRHVVCYKSASEDPIRRTDPTVTTVNWREAPLLRPESRMIGQQYACNPVDADMVLVDPSAWVFAGANVTGGQRIIKLVGEEYDGYVAQQQGPPNVQILAHSPVTCHGRPGFSDMTYYSAPSGAGVFAVGTNRWILRLTPTTFPNAGNEPVVVQVTKNVLAAFGSGPAGAHHPSTANYDDIAKRYGGVGKNPSGRA
jgi:hypothetical protein